LGEISKNIGPSKLIKIKVIDKVKVEDLPEETKEGMLQGQVLSNNKNTEFWKKALDISKDLTTSMALTATGNIPATVNVVKNSLTKHLNQQLNDGIVRFNKSISDIKSDKEIVTMFSFPIITAPEEDEKIYKVTLYQVRWAATADLPKQNLFEDFKNRTDLRVSDFEEIASQRHDPLILVIET